MIVILLKIIYLNYVMHLHMYLYVQLHTKLTKENNVHMFLKTILFEFLLSDHKVTTL